MHLQLTLGWLDFKSKSTTSRHLIAKLRLVFVVACGLKIVNHFAD